jgi:hypothetical protein
MGSCYVFRASSSVVQVVIFPPGMVPQTRDFDIELYVFAP